MRNMYLFSSRRGDFQFTPASQSTSSGNVQFNALINQMFGRGFFAIDALEHIPK